MYGFAADLMFVVLLNSGMASLLWCSNRLRLML